MRVGWQRERRVTNFDESRVAKGGFGLGKLNQKRASGGIVSKTVLVESEESYSD